MITIAQPDHRMLRGLRFFAFGDNVARLKNLAGRGGGDGVASGSPTASVILGQGFRAINGDATDNAVVFDRFDSYWGNEARSITVIVRGRSNSSHIGAPVTAYNGSGAGWNILYSNFGGSETGWNFVVRSVAGKYMEVQDGVGDGSVAGKDVVFAGVYNHMTHNMASYLRLPGEPAATIRNGSYTNTNSSNTNTEDWDVRAGSTPLEWLQFASPATPFYFNGDMAWCAVFDRAMSNDEIAEFSQDENWEFLNDYPIVTDFTARRYSTLIRVAGSGGYSQDGGSRSYANEIGAEVVMTGDLTNVGSGSDTHSYRTTIQARQAFYYGFPQFMRFKNIVSVQSGLTPAEQRTFRTRVGVRSPANQLLDGRRDLLKTGGYRR